jgi:hypothetical protein
MKKSIKILSTIVLVGIIYLAIEGTNMQTIKTEIEIIAPPSKVWNIITDIKKWQDWSPTINASQGEASLGSTLSITMMSKEEGKDGPKYNPKIIKLDEPNYFHWRAHMMAGFLFTNDKIFELKEKNSGTKLIHTETFKGLLAPLFRGQMKKGVPPMLHSMNEALKDLAEK